MKPDAQPRASSEALHDLQRELELVASGLAEGDLQPRPDGRWNAVQILEHLYLTYTGTTKGINHVLETSPNTRARTVPDRVRTFTVTRLNYLPEGRKAPERTLPKGVEVSVVRSQIAAKLAAMHEVLNQCEQKFGSSTRLLDHPVLGPLTADEWRRFHVVHGRHHLKQIRQRLAAAGRP